jgi:hypothetical protein
MIVLDHSPTLATRGIIVYGTSTIYQTIFITKMTVRSGPFSELENDVRQKSRTTFRTGKELPNLDHFPNWKMTAHESIIYQCSLPTWGAISSLSAKGVISTSPILSLKYANFILDKGFVKISATCSSVEIYWSFTSPSWTLS